LLLLMYIPKAFERPRDEGNWLLYRHRRRGGWW
jgi:hypothetical protein